MTTLTSYAELKQNIQDYAKRNDILGKLDLFIDLAERDIWDVVRIRDMEVRATASTSTTDRFIQLPTGFIAMRQLQITVDGVLYDMDENTPKSMQISDSAGCPNQYVVTSQLELNRTSDQVYTLEMDYWKELTALSASNTTNAVLTQHPMIYLSRCMFHFCQWALQLERTQYWDSVFNHQVARANRKARQGRYGAAPAAISQGWVV